MTNAKEELLQTLQNKAAVMCASLSYGDNYDEENHVAIILKVGYTQEEFTDFLKKLDFRYDNGYGSQQLFGFIWLEDNSWLTRAEYDGSEWWQHETLPAIPVECLK